MGYIKEPEGVDFVVDPTPLTKIERERISEIIAFYKLTGRKIPSIRQSKKKPGTKIHAKVAIKKNLLQ